jgi:hypothetical protein
MNKRWNPHHNSSKLFHCIFENITCPILGYITNKSPVLSLGVRDSLFLQQEQKIIGSGHLVSIKAQDI